MKAEIAALVGRAESSLQAASRLYEDSFYDFAISRAYYAMFYMASAALLNRGLRFRRHGTVVASFGEQFIKSGLLPPHLQKHLSRGFEQRARSDYQVLEEVTGDESLDILRQAEEFVDTVRAFLEKESQI